MKHAIAFVKFSSPMYAARAIESLNGTRLGKHIMRLEPYKSRPPDSRRTPLADGTSAGAVIARDSTVMRYSVASRSRLGETKPEAEVEEHGSCVQLSEAEDGVDGNEDDTVTRDKLVSERLVDARVRGTGREGNSVMEGG